MKHRLAALVMLLIIRLQTSCSRSDRWPTDRFDAAKWRSAKQEQRYKMVNDLIDRHLLIGLTPSELEQLLGPPTSWGLGRAYCTYVVKVGGTGFNQIFILDVGFDAATEKVVSARVRGD